jgi:hypothetical protein
MSSLLFLSSEDFYTTRVQNDVSLCHNIQGFSVLLFYSTQCVHSQKAFPIFRKLPEIVNGCQFGLVNVSTNRQLIQLTQQTTTPIRYVPLIILYINGRPYMKYTGAITEPAIRQFVIDVSKSVHESGFAKVAKQKGVPSYCVGQPLCGEDEVCYLEFNPKEGYHASK